MLCRAKLQSLSIIHYPLSINSTPGTVLQAAPAGIIVQCGGGTLLKITELQLSGGRRMPVKDFLLGRKIPAGTVLCAKL